MTGEHLCTWTCTYDTVGNLHTELNPSQVLFTYTYDSLNRLDIETVDLTAGGTTHAASFDYDVRARETQ